MPLTYTSPNLFKAVGRNLRDILTAISSSLNDHIGVPLLYGGVESGDSSGRNGSRGSSREEVTLMIIVTVVE